MQVRDGPAAVRGDAPAPSKPLAIGPGRRRGREPRVRRPAARLQLEPLAEGGFVLQASLLFVAVARDGAACSSPRPSALRVHVRVEGKTQHDLRLDRADADRQGERARRARLGQRRPASSTTTSRPTSFGPYVDQIGRYVAGGSTGWVFKVNGVSPPVGRRRRRAEGRRPRALVLGHVRPDRRPDDALLRAGTQKRNCYRVLAQDDTGKTQAGARGDAARRRAAASSPAPARRCVGATSRARDARR